MKAILAGAFGRLGSEVLKQLIAVGYDVNALDLKDGEIPQTAGKYTFCKVDAYSKDTLRGSCTGGDVLILCMGMRKDDTTHSYRQMDYEANKNVMEVAMTSGVKHVIFVSDIDCDKVDDVPMLEAKHLFEDLLKSSGMTYAIIRATPSFDTLADYFEPRVEKGVVRLLDKEPSTVNPIDNPDLAHFIMTQLEEYDNQVFSIGGTETYTYEEIAKIFFEEMDKPVKIKYMSAFRASAELSLAKSRRDGSLPRVKYQHWALTHTMNGMTKYGAHSFKAYCDRRYAKQRMDRRIQAALNRKEED